MQAHEVPTHVQAEDHVLLWFTFPQIVAMTAVCALAYGVYHYAPFGPSEARMALAVLFGLAGLAVVAGRIGGRRLPLVAADLLRFGLGRGATPGLRPSWRGASRPRRRNPLSGVRTPSGCWRGACCAGPAAPARGARRASAATGACPSAPPPLRQAAAAG